MVQMVLTGLMVTICKSTRMIKTIKPQIVIKAEKSKKNQGLLILKVKTRLIHIPNLPPQIMVKIILFGLYSE